MNTSNLNLIAVAESRVAGFAGKAIFMFLVIFTLLLCVLASVRADGLFDFQMKLAEKGNAEAQFKVGEMYETGFGVKEDKEQALNWITKAADQGHETAGFKLLYWDIEKNGITDANKAQVEALEAEAYAGNPQAQFYVGKMYSRGVGKKRDTDTALDWLNKAALVGVLEAEREITMVRENKQLWAMEQKRKEEKRQAELRAKQEKERQVRLEQQRKLQAQKEAEARARALEADKKNKAAAEANAKARQQAADKARKEQLLAQQQADAKRREAEKQALIKKREAEEAKRKTQFESDPCSGKSARFLSTCR